MRKVAIALVIVIGIAVLATPLIGGLLARKAHAVLVENLAQVEASTQGTVRVTSQGFELGWLSSKAHMRVEVGPPGTSWSFPLLHLIHHGPLPIARAARGLSIAVIDTTIEGARTGDGQQPLHGETVIGMTGDVGVDLTSLALPRREDVAWEGGSATLRVGGQGTRIAAQASAPRFELHTPSGEVLLEALKVDYTSERAQEGPSVGAASYALGRARFTSPENQRNLAIDGFSWSSKAAFNPAGKLDSTFALRLGGIDLGDQSYRNVGVELALRDLDAAAMEALGALGRQLLQLGSTQQAPEQITSQLQALLMQELPRLLASSSQIELKDAHVDTLDGRIDAELSAARDPSSSAGAGQMQFRGRLVLPLPMFGALTRRAAGELAPAARQANDTQSLNVIADQIAEILLTRGYVAEEEDGRVSSAFVYGPNQFELNGQAVDLGELLMQTGALQSQPQ